LGGRPQRTLSEFGVEAPIAEKARGWRKKEGHCSDGRRRRTCGICIVRLYEKHHLEEAGLEIQPLHLAEEQSELACWRDATDEAHRDIAAVKELVSHSGRHNYRVSFVGYMLFAAYDEGDGAGLNLKSFLLVRMDVRSAGMATGSDRDKPL
jgi:hypothetical protein